MVDIVETDALPVASTVADADEAIINQGGATKRLTFALIFAYMVGKLFPAWTTWVPVMSYSDPPAGTGFAYTVTDAKAFKIGKTVIGSATVTVTNLGTGPTAAGYMNVTLPYASLRKSAVWGFEDATLGHGVGGRILAGTSVAQMKSAAGPNFGVNSRVTFCFCYETA